MDRLVVAPGPVHTERLRRGTVAVGLETFDELADVLIMISGGHQHDVRRRGDDEIINAERRDQRSLAAYVAPRRVFQDYVADRHVAGPILVSYRPKRGPTSD